MCAKGGAPISSPARSRSASRVHWYRNRLAWPLTQVTLFTERLRSSNSTNPTRLPIRHDAWLLGRSQKTFFDKLANHRFLPAISYGHYAREGLAALCEYYILASPHSLHDPGEMLVGLAQPDLHPACFLCRHVTTFGAGLAKDQPSRPGSDLQKGVLGSFSDGKSHLEEQNLAEHPILRKPQAAEHIVFAQQPAGIPLA